MFNFNWAQRTSGVKFAKIQVKHQVTRDLIHRFLCKHLAVYGREHSFTTRASVESEIRERLVYQGSCYADYWHEDVEEDERAECEALADQLIDAYFPELAPVKATT